MEDDDMTTPNAPINYSYRITPRERDFAIERTHGDPADPQAFWTPIASGGETESEARSALADYERAEARIRERYAEACKRFVDEPATREDIDAMIYVCVELQRRGAAVATGLDPATWHKLMTMVVLAHDVLPHVDMALAQMLRRGVAS